MNRNYNVVACFQKIVTLRRPEETIFADIIKIVNMFIKTIIKDSRKVRGIINHVSKWIYISIS